MTKRIPVLLPIALMLVSLLIGACTEAQLTPQAAATSVVVIEVTEEPTTPVTEAAQEATEPVTETRVAEAEQPATTTPVQPTEPAQETQAEGAPEGWTTYINDIYGYSVQYPAGAKITEAEKSLFSLPNEEFEQGITFDDVYAKYTGKICVHIEFELGYVYISAPDNESFSYVLCGRTGAAYEMVDKQEPVVIDGTPTLARGFEEKGPGDTLDYHNETLVVTLDDGTRIEYGAMPVDTATFEDYLDMRDELLTIVQSFQRINGGLRTYHGPGFSLQYSPNARLRITTTDPAATDEVHIVGPSVAVRPADADWSYQGPAYEMIVQTYDNPDKLDAESWARDHIVTAAQQAIAQSEPLMGLPVSEDGEIIEHRVGSSVMAGRPAFWAKFFAGDSDRRTFYLADNDRIVALSYFDYPLANQPLAMIQQDVYTAMMNTLRFEEK